MADETPATTNGAADQTAPNLSLQGVYLKDCSYEAPHGAAFRRRTGHRRSALTWPPPAT